MKRKVVSCLLAFTVATTTGFTYSPVTVKASEIVSQDQTADQTAEQIQVDDVEEESATGSSDGTSNHNQFVNLTWDDGKYVDISGTVEANKGELVLDVFEQDLYEYIRSLGVIQTKNYKHNNQDNTEYMCWNHEDSEHAVLGGTSLSESDTKIPWKNEEYMQQVYDQNKTAIFDKDSDTMRVNPNNYDDMYYDTKYDKGSDLTLARRQLDEYDLAFSYYKEELDSRLAPKQDGAEVMKTDDITNNICQATTWVSIDNQFRIQMYNVGAKIKLKAFNVVGDATSANVRVPDKIRYYYVQSATPVYKQQLVEGKNGLEPKYMKDSDGNKIFDHWYIKVKTGTAPVYSISTAFSGSGHQFRCRDLALYLPDKISDIPAKAFQGNTKLRYVYFGASPQSIGTSAFEGCTRLLGINVKDYDKNEDGTPKVLEEPYDLKQQYEPIMVDDTTYQIVAKSKINGTEKILNIPDSLLQKFSYASIDADCGVSDGQLNGPNVIDKSVVKAHGIKINELRAYFNSPLKSYKNSWGKYDSNYDFYYKMVLNTPYEQNDVEKYDTYRNKDYWGIDNSNEKTTSSKQGFENIFTYLPSGKISNRAFYNCSSLANISIPSCVYNIGEEAFFGCNQLDTVYLGKNIQNVSDDAFSNCANLRYVYSGRQLEDCDSSRVMDTPEKYIDTTVSPKVVQSGRTTPITATANTLRVSSKAKNNVVTVYSGVDMAPTTSIIDESESDKDKKEKKTPCEYTVTDNGKKYTTKAYKFSVSAPRTYSINMVDELGNRGTLQIRTYSDVNDKTKPVITYYDRESGEEIKSGKYFKGVDILFSDNAKAGEESSGVALVELDGEVYDYSELEDGTLTVLEDGKHTLTVTDGAGNVTTDTFVIDTTAPNVEGVISETVYTDNVTISAEDEESGIAHIRVSNRGTDGNKIEGTTKDFGNKSSVTITQDGNYIVEVENNAGVVATKTFVLEKSAPALYVGNGVGAYTKIKSGDSLKTLKNIMAFSSTGIKSIEVVAEHTDGSKDDVYLDLTTPKTGTIDGVPLNSGNSAENSKEFTENGDYTINITSMSGNTSTYTLSVDSIKPTISGVIDGEIISEDAEFSIYVDDLHLDTEKTVLTKVGSKGSVNPDGKGFEFAEGSNNDGMYTLTVYDKAGNTTDTVHFVKSTSAPSISGVKDGGKYSKLSKITVSDKAGIKSIDVRRDGKKVGVDELLTTTNNCSFEKVGYYLKGVINARNFISGKYNIAVTNISGKKSYVTFKLDNRLPKIKPKTKAKLTETSKNVTSYYFGGSKAVLNVTDDTGVQTVTLDGEKVSTSKVTITKEGKHTLVVTDEFSNKVKAIVYLDKTAPTYSVTSGSTIKLNSTVKVSGGVSKLSKIVVYKGTKAVKTITKNPKSYKFTSRGKFTIKAYDKSGNSSKCVVVVK